MPVYRHGSRVRPEFGRDKGYRLGPLPPFSPDLSAPLTTVTLTRYPSLLVGSHYVAIVSVFRQPSLSVDRFSDHGWQYDSSTRLSRPCVGAGDGNPEVDFLVRIPDVEHEPKVNCGASQ